MENTFEKYLLKHIHYTCESKMGVHSKNRNIFPGQCDNVTSYHNEKHCTTQISDRLEKDF